MQHQSKNEHADPYQQITDKIIESLELGVAPWSKPWKAGGWPVSMSTGKRYAGVNAMVLGFSGFPSKWFGTYRQIQELGGQVRKGEQSTLVTFWKELQKEDPDRTDPKTGDPAIRRIPMLRTFRVFNACQADGLPEKFQPVQGNVEPDADAEAMIGAYLTTGTAPALLHDVHGRAYYDIDRDVIHLPPPSEHTSAARYASTALHELVHGTGAKSRLDRWPDGTSLAMHSNDRGVEELTAEIGACFLLSECGAGTDTSMEANTAYVASWLEAIRADKKLVIRAASAAQKAADVIAEPSRQAGLSADLDREAAA